MTDISIAIVAYNDEEDVCRAVESIEAYTSMQITKKIYIIDNSTAANELSALEQKYGDCLLYTSDSLNNSGDLMRDSSCIWKMRIYASA